MRLGVGGDVVIGVHPVPGFHDDFVTDGEERSERMVSGGACLDGEFERAGQERIVVGLDPRLPHDPTRSSCRHRAGGVGVRC
jgi:hypothetical protein